MAFILDKVYKRVYQLSDRINFMYKVDPEIQIQFGSEQHSIIGFCSTPYKMPDMGIDIVVPWDCILSKQDEVLLDVILCHEYCHYIEALGLTAAERQRLTYLYEEDTRTRKLDEQKTWRQTRKLAKRLGIWNKQFYNCIHQYIYAGWLKY